MNADEHRAWMACWKTAEEYEVDEDVFPSQAFQDKNFQMRCTASWCHLFHFLFRVQPYHRNQTPLIMQWDDGGGVHLG